MTETRAPKGMTPNIDVVPVHRAKTRLPWPLDLYQTAVGKKWVMALTGIGLLGFVFAHMFGNLKMYLGPEEFNAYAEGLRELFHPILPKYWALWGMRLGMVVCFILHLHSAYSLTLMNRRAKPAHYTRQDYLAANWAARTMRVSGILLLAFILMHLGNLTMGWWMVKAPPGFREGDVYSNVVHTLDNPVVALLYIVGQVALAFHIWHGAWSLFQSLGINNPRINPLRKGFAYGFTAIVCGINITFPIAVLAGVVKV